MATNRIEALESQLNSLNQVILAAEDWSKEYGKSPKHHAALIKWESKFERKLRDYFRTLAKDRIHNYIDWTVYQSQAIQAFDVKVIFIDSDFEDSEEEIFMNVVHDPLLDGLGIGIDAGQDIYQRDLGLSKVSANVQKAARDYAADLVKGVNSTTKDRIKQSIETSLTLGENHEEASSRLGDIIDDPDRAGMIARTEAVNAYSQGIMTFGNESGATQKEWNDVGAVDECADNTSDGPIDIDDSFSSGDDMPPAHPNCRCGVQLIYPDGSEADSGEGE